jgi:tetratricopeptide (TPR) repeat protein
VEIGRFEEAQSWYERTVEEKQQGVIEGRIDHASLGGSLHMGGVCLSSVGKFEEARPWYERAVEAKQQGDMDRRVDHASLGRSLHEVGVCLSSIGKFEEARPWYERAVEETQQGDTDGLIDHTRLGESLREVGVCFANVGRFEEARPWFERAVEEMQQGDRDGRIDHTNLGRSLHEVGVCFATVGRLEEARPWFERAVEEKQQGDTLGRVNHVSLGSSLRGVGFCLGGRRHFEEAWPWYERAVHEMQQGDIHGRVDHASLGKSLQEVGSWLSSDGDFEKARLWHERAVQEMQQGDIHGRIDHESVGRSLHDVGVCLSSLGKFEEAQLWYERAVEEKQQGDAYGRVNHESLGNSLHQVGFCLFVDSVGKVEEARPWFERAVVAKQQGDVYGRVDHLSLGQSLLQVSGSQAIAGRFDEARMSFERAITALQKGYDEGSREDTSLRISTVLPLIPPGLPHRLQISHLRLRNIRAFEDTGVIVLPPEGVVLIGENSTGKSTLLRCIALGVLGPALANQVEPRPASYLRRGARKGFVEIAFRLCFDRNRNVELEFTVGLEIPEGETSFQDMASHDLTLDTENSARRLDLLRRRANDDFGFCCGYGSLRTFADSSSLMPSNDKDAIERVLSLFDSHAPVVDPDVLAKLLTGNLANFRSAPPEGLEESTLAAMRKHIHSLLPNCGELSAKSYGDIPLHGSEIPFRDLSDGYASLLALVGHLFRYSLPASNWRGDPASVGGIMLVDELDAHLHPSWQRHILLDLRRIFPNLQILSTTHSPMIAGSIATEFVRVLKREDSDVLVISDLPSIEGWRADQILTSMLFDLNTSRSFRTEEMFRRYANLLANYGPDDSRVKELGPQVAKSMEIDGEGEVDRVTLELLDQLLLERFKGLDEETRHLILAKAGLVAGKRR